MAGRLKYADKIKMVIDYFKTNSPTIVAKKYKVGTPTVYRWVERFKNDPEVLKAIKSIEKTKELALTEITAKSIEADKALIEAIKSESREVNTLAFERLKEIIPKEKNLDHLLKVYVATTNVLLPDNKEQPEDQGKSGNTFNQLNIITQKMISNADES